jgi:hypothetical protein
MRMLTVAVAVAPLAGRKSALLAAGGAVEAGAIEAKKRTSEASMKHVISSCVHHG